MPAADLQVRRLGLMDYERVWHAMQAFTNHRDPQTPDELWLVQHPPVFTQGQAGKAEHILAPGDIPVIQVDRGGQVTYHGPGQIVAYPLIDIKRLGMGVRELVRGIEQAIIQVLNSYDIQAGLIAGAPGVYIDGVKIASLGLRIRKGKSFHGLAFNIAMDLEPFQRINPCGFQGLQVTQLSALANEVRISDVEERLLVRLRNWAPPRLHATPRVLTRMRRYCASRRGSACACLQAMPWPNSSRVCATIAW
jgi:lipoyl(octanoyl) transferase